MINITATELKNHLGQYLAISQSEPVMIEELGRDSHVLLSGKRYDELIANEDKYWQFKAELAEQDGFLSEEETRALIE